MRKGTIEDAPECRECDGHCCKKFYYYVQGTEKPTQEQIREKLDASGCHGWRMVDGAEITNQGMRWWSAEATCDWLVDGRCSHYDERPDACRTFPNWSLGMGISGEESTCALTRRIAAEMAVQSAEETACKAFVTETVEE